MATKDFNQSWNLFHCNLKPRRENEGSHTTSFRNHYSREVPAEPPPRYITAGEHHWIHTTVCHLLQHALTPAQMSQVLTLFYACNVTAKQWGNRQTPLPRRGKLHITSSTYSKLTLLGADKGINWHFGKYTYFLLRVTTLMFMW